jgi:hypothetical protein
MQISRHWRLNAKRYRLEGVRYTTGDVSLQNRTMTAVTQTAPVHTEQEKRAIAAA